MVISGKGMVGGICSWGGILDSSVSPAPCTRNFRPLDCYFLHFNIIFSAWKFHFFMYALCLFNQIIWIATLTLTIAKAQFSEMHSMNVP